MKDNVQISMKITKKTRVFITGCGGMLGEAVHAVWSAVATVKCTDIDTRSPFISYGDVRDHADMKRQIDEFNPDLIIHLAAHTSLEYCEVQKDDAFKTNTESTKNLADIAKERDIPMIYISTAGIYDGKKEFYTEDDKPNPISVYGQSKYDGELYVLENLQKYYVFRAGWMMGGGAAKDKKFVAKVMKQIIEGTKELNVVDDKLGTPTYTYDFAKNMLFVVTNGSYGLYNMICDGSCSRYDVAREIVKILGRTDIKVNKVTSEYFKEEYFAPRPASEKLIPKRLKDNGLYIMRPWKECLNEYIQKQWLSYAETAGSFSFA